ncbi:MAG: MMPL family transporter [Planctomycetia bacterium]|nr:MMPL family transporter [Planctomycetia bacterium]
MSHPEEKCDRFLNAPLRWLILLLLAVLYGFILYGANEAKKTSSNRVIDWFPTTFPETRKCQWFWGHFGTDELLMISWDGLGPDDEIQEMLANRLMESPGKDAKGKPMASYFARVMTTRQMLEKLEKDIRAAYAAQNLDPPKRPRLLAEERLSGWLISRDRKQGAIVAVMSPVGAQDRHAVLKKVYDDTMLFTGLSHQQIHIAGSSCDSVAIDDASNTSRRTLLPIFATVCFCLLAVSLRNFVLTVTVFSLAILNEEFGPGLIYFTGSHMDSISLLVSSLVFVLTLECGIHLANYYRDAVRETGEKGAVMSTLRKGWLPCFLATFTTVLGMGSLAISQVTPIRNFGIYSSLSLSLGTLCLFLFLPSWWENVPPFRYTLSGIHTGGQEKKLAMNRKSDRLWHMLALFIARTHWGIIAIALILLGLALPCMFQIQHTDAGPELECTLKTTVSLHGMLPDKNEVIIDYNYLEEKFGGLVPIEVILRIPKAGNEDCTWLEQCELVKLVDDAVSQVEGADGTMTLLDFLPDLPKLTRRGSGAAIARRKANTQLGENIDALKGSGYFYDAPEEWLWRISLRVPANLQMDYAPFLKKLEGVVYETLYDAGIDCRIAEQRVKDSPHLAAIAKKFAERKNFKPEKGRPHLRVEEVSTVVTGAIPLVFQAQKQLLKDLIDSFFMAFGLIVVTMIALLRGVRAGIVAMLPNIFPSVVIFGIFAFLNIEIDIGSMMTASVALGITVDGTLHFLTWFKRGIADGRERRDAVIYAYTHCANAMLQTAFICGFSFLVFCASGFMPVARFAWMLCILLVTAVLADMFLTPALLISPLGKVFVKRIRKTGENLNPAKNVPQA